MVPWVKVPAANPSDLNSIPETNMVKRDSQLPPRCFLTLRTQGNTPHPQHTEPHTLISKASVPIYVQLLIVFICLCRHISHVIVPHD